MDVPLAQQEADRPLAGARVLVTRSPERSTGLVSALSAAGASVVLLPLIDFERAADQHALDVACDALGAGAYSWLVLSSATTVQVLAAKAAERGLTLGSWLPAATRVAAIGPATRRLLEANGVRVDRVPSGDQSAAGLLADWPAGTGSLLLPQADIAASRLAIGLRAAGHDVTVVTAYRTVDFPAAPERRLHMIAEADHDGGKAPVAPLITPGSAAVEIAKGRISAVLAASPSAVRRLAEMLPDQPFVLVAIGRSTADQAAALQVPVAAVAADPSPAGLVAAVIAAVRPGLSCAPP